MVRTHPVTGRRSLYVGRHASHIVGMDEQEGRALLRELTENACQPPRIFRHQRCVARSEAGNAMRATTEPSAASPQRGVDAERLQQGRQPQLRERPQGDVLRADAAWPHQGQGVDRHRLQVAVRLRVAGRGRLRAAGDQLRDDALRLALDVRRHVVEQVGLPRERSLDALAERGPAFAVDVEVAAEVEQGALADAGRKTRNSFYGTTFAPAIMLRPRINDLRDEIDRKPPKKGTFDREMTPGLANLG